MKIERKLGHKEAKGLLCKVEFPISLIRELFSIWLALGVGWFQLHPQPHLKLSELGTAKQGEFQELKKFPSQGIQDLIRGQVAAQGL